MIVRIGFTRWFISATSKRNAFGKATWTLSMLPEAETYEVSTKKTFGLDVNEVVCSVNASDVSVRGEIDIYEMSMKKKKLEDFLTRLADELAAQSVLTAMTSDLVSFSETEHLGSIEVVRTLILRRIGEVLYGAESTNKAYVWEKKKSISLIQQMNEQKAAKEIAEREARERERALRREHEERYRADLERHKEVSKQRVETSFDLLYSYLSDKEIEEAKNHNRITINNFLGEWVVPVSSHGLVKRRVSNVREGDYCIIFADSSIPIGDEVLMKVALLKSNPKKFIEKANRFEPRSV